MATAEVTIAIRAKNEASKAFKDVLKDIAHMKANAGDAFGALQKVGKTAFLGLAAGAAVGGIALAKFAQDASKANESLSKVNVVFRSSAGEITKWAKTSATAFGLSRQQSLEAAGTFGNLFTAMRVGIPDATKMSKSLVELSADLGSFNNVPVEDALVALRSGLVGEVEPLRRFGVAINAAVVEEKALALGLATSKDAISESAKVQARYALILEQTQTAQGDFARTSDGLANSQKTLSAIWADTKVSLGNVLLPLMTKATQAASEFLIKNQESIKGFGEAISTALKAVADAAEIIAKKLKPAFDLLDNKDRVAIMAALAAVIAGPLVVAMLAFAAASALAFVTNPVFLFIAAIALITVAVTLMVRHWDQVWATMKQAPAAVIDFVQKHFVDLLIGLTGPAGVLFLLIKHWRSIFSAMPAPVQHAMNAVSGFIENMVNGALVAINKLIEGINKLIDGINKVKLIGDNIPKIPSIGDVDFTIPTSDRFKGQGVGRFADGQFLRDVGAAADDALPALEAYSDGIGGSGAAAETAVNEFADLLLAFQQWNRLTGESVASFTARLELQQREVELDNQIADAQFRVAVEAAKATDGATSLRIGLKELALEAIRSGRTITEVMRDTWEKIVDDIQSAFDGLFSRPSQEQAQLNLEIALLEEQKARERAADASDEEIKAIDDQIDALKRQKDVFSTHDDVLRAQIDVANKSLLTEEQKNFAALLYIAAMNIESTKLGQLADQAGLEAVARTHMINAMLTAADAYNSSAGISAADSNQQFFDSLPPQERADLARLLEELARQGRLANGTSYWRGGSALVGEHGPEILNLPRGSQVIPAHETKELLSPAPQTVYIDNLNVYGDPAAGLAALGQSL